MPKISKVILQLGSNMGNSQIQFMKAQRLIEARIGYIKQASALYTTAAWGIANQPDFLNQVIEVATKLKSGVLIDTVLAIEEEMGRVRNILYGPRIIDIDILFFNSEIINTKKLTIPHPLLQHRRFVLAPMEELIPDFIHPVLYKTVATLLAECTDTMYVQKN